MKIIFDLASGGFICRTFSMLELSMGIIKSNVLKSSVFNNLARCTNLISFILQTLNALLSGKDPVIWDRNPAESHSMNESNPSCFIL